MAKKKRRALVLAGGGARGAFQVGMLQTLVLERGLDFQILRGVSVGALNAALLAQAPTAGDSLAHLERQVKRLARMWLRRIEGNHSIYGKRTGFLGVAVGADSLYTVEPLRRLLRDNLELDALRSSGRDFRAGTTSLLHGRYESWSPAEPDFLERLIASASVPMAFPFVDLEGPGGRDVLVDGGVRNITPLGEAFDADPPADEIYVLLTSRVISKEGRLPDSSVMVQPYARWDDNALGTRVGALDVLRRTADILTDEIYLEDLRRALEWNATAGAIERFLGTARRYETKLPPALAKALRRLEGEFSQVEKRSVPIHVLSPTRWFGEENAALEFSPTLIRQAVRHGREIARDDSLWLCHHGVLAGSG